MVGIKQSALKTGGSTARWRLIRERILKRDGYVCQLCGDDERARLTVDHIVPRRLGGNDEDSNLQTLCKRCNYSKGGRFFEHTPTPPTPLVGFSPENGSKRHYQEEAG